MCGENIDVSVIVPVNTGSSPRVRGKLRSHPRGRSSHRLIPACAGKTTTILKPLSVRWAHPRVCGENQGWQRFQRSGLGSSPRVRGKPARLRLRLRHAGLIPACAGKTSQQRGPETANLGSSPRVRGKHPHRAREDSRLRLIPACAGKTSVSPGSTLRLAAHPRVCGENFMPKAYDVCHMGSSPRVRGKPRMKQVPLVNAGLIPACAGKTSGNMNG